MDLFQQVAYHMVPIKHILSAVAAAMLLTACNDELTPADVGQKAAALTVSGFSKDDALQLVFNGEPLRLSGKDSYTGKIDTTLRFVVDEGETNTLSIYSTNAEKELANYHVNYENVSETSTLNFYNLPEIFLEASVVKPTVRLGYVGYEFIFPNLGEFSGVKVDSVRGVLKKEDGTELARFSGIGRGNFTDVQSYRAFSNAAPIYLELYQQDNEEPYFGSQILRVRLKQHAGACLIVLQEYRDESSGAAVRGNIDVTEYL